MRRYLKSLVFEELSLFGKKKPVFLPQDLDRIGRLLTKAIQRVPNHKIIHYELETSRGTTAGDLFASKEYIHWRFDSIKGMNFSGRSYTSFGNTNWRMVPQSGQEYRAVRLRHRCAEKNMAGCGRPSRPRSANIHALCWTVWTVWTVFPETPRKS